jgi:hypothetical protein
MLDDYSKQNDDLATIIRQLEGEVGEGDKPGFVLFQQVEITGIYARTRISFLSRIALSGEP